MKANFKLPENKLNAEFKMNEKENLKASFDIGQGGGVKDYEKLTNKPLINDIELIGNKTSEDLGLASKSSINDINDRLNGLDEDIVTLQDDINNVNSNLGTSINNVRNSLNSEIVARQNADTNLQGQINTINSKIPSQASSSNQLADKDFVNSSIATNTATFRGTFNSVAELEAYSGEKDNNDYAYVTGSDSLGNTYYDNYIYNGTAWVFRYRLNNSSFTAEQWGSINSGITTSDVTQIVTNQNDISNLQTSKQDKLTAGENITITEGVELPEGYTLLDSVIADGNQYIDTGILPDLDTSMNLKFKLLQTVGIAIAGSRDDANRNNFSCFTGSTGYFFEYFNNSSYTNYRLQVANFSANVIYSASISKYSRTLYDNIGNVVGVNTRINNDNFNATRSIYLGAVNNVDIDGFDGAFYNFQIEKNNILVANYIPCLNPNNIAGFYDTVSETFKRSSTGTDFIAGNIIPAGNIISATVPTKVSQLENDKEYLTSGDVSTVALTGDIEDIVGIDIQNPEDGQILVYSEVYATWQNSSVLDTKQNATSLLVPDTTGMTPIATYEYDISTAAYRVFCTVENNFTSLSQVKGDAIFKMTITGTNINSVVEGIISMRQTVSAAPYIFLRNFAGTETAALSGIRYIRPTYPKALNNGYDWIFELYPSSSTARHIKLEVFQSSDIFQWNSTLETATINTTYQTSATNITLYNIDGVTGLPSLNISVSSSTSASYISAYLNKFLGGTSPISGEAISAYNITYLSTDNKMHPQTNTTAIINPDFGLQVVRANVNANVNVGNTIIAQKSAINLTSIPHDSYVQGNMIYLRCTMDSSGNIHSDNYLATSMGAGYTWYSIGTAASATVVNVDTINSMFMTLDSSGNLTHINGKPLGIATNQITIGNTTINESQLQALLNLI